MTALKTMRNNAFAPPIICLSAGLLAGLAFYLALELSEAGEEKRRAISELNEIRTMREWGYALEGRSE